MKKIFRFFTTLSFAVLTFSIYEMYPAQAVEESQVISNEMIEQKKSNRWLRLNKPLYEQMTPQDQERVYVIWRDELNGIQRDIEMGKGICKGFSTAGEVVARNIPDNNPAVVSKDVENALLLAKIGGWIAFGTGSLAFLATEEISQFILCAQGWREDIDWMSLNRTPIT